MALRPSAVVLKGQFGRVEKLNPARHGDDLWHATGGHDRIWTYMSYGPFADAKTFSRWLVERAALADPFAYTVINQPADRPCQCRCSAHAKISQGYRGDCATCHPLGDCPRWEKPGHEPGFYLRESIALDGE